MVGLSTALPNHHQRAQGRWVLSNADHHLSSDGIVNAFAKSFQKRLPCTICNCAAVTKDDKQNIPLTLATKRRKVWGEGRTMLIAFTDLYEILRRQFGDEDARRLMDFFQQNLARLATKDDLVQLEHRLMSELVHKADKEDFARLWEVLERKADKEDVAALRAELQRKADKEDVARLEAEINRRALQETVTRIEEELKRKADKEDVARLEAEINRRALQETVTRIEEELKRKADKEDVAALRAELQRKADKEDVARLWEVLERKADKEDVAALRAELQRKADKEDVARLWEALERKADKEDVAQLREMIVRLEWRMNFYFAVLLLVILLTNPKVWELLARLLPFVR